MNKFTFGKYKGWDLDKIRLCDPQYIVWLHENANLIGPMKEAIAAIYVDCVEAANRKNASEPQKRKAFHSEYSQEHQYAE